MKINIRNLFIVSIPILFLYACGQQPAKQLPKQEGIKKDQFEMASIEVDISNENCLAIMLVKDGTINRKGSAIVDSADHDFFMGMTQEKLFDHLMETVSDDLLAYCQKPSPGCDTTKSTCKAKVSFAGNQSNIGFEYCVNGTLDDLPKPVNEFIVNAVKITDPWYQAQKKMVGATNNH